MIHKAKKSLGQNFLKSNLVIKKIIEAGEISKEDIILEIGPGKGALTEKLLEKADCVIAVEKDYALFEFLKNKFEKEITENKLILINDDILEIDIKKIKSILERTLGSRKYAGDIFLNGDGQRKFSTENFRGEPENAFYFNYKIIANIPYNITGAIFKKFLGDINQPELMVLMVQNEVAKRIVARDGKESILSISVKVYGDPKIITKVPARYFSPEPAVDSAVIAIKNISRALFVQNPTLNTSSQSSTYKVGEEKVDEKKFFDIIHAGFAHKRKKLSSNLKILLKNSIYQGESLMKILGNKRAEELKIEEWVELAKK